MLFELAVHRLRSTDPDAVAVYICPLKALVAQRETDWKRMWGNLVGSLSGDTLVEEMDKGMQGLQKPNHNNKQALLSQSLS